MRIMNVSELLKKLFLGGTWYVGIREHTMDDNVKSRSYLKVDVPSGQWIADPFLFENNGRHYLFCEQYFVSKQKASIGLFEIIDGIATNNKIIIDNNYHMSYPCVFEYEGRFFLIPESSANKSIDIYESESFPSKWKLRKTLLKGERYVDSTVILLEGNYYLITYKKGNNGWSLVLFLLDMKKLMLDYLCEKSYSANVARPAGHLYYDNGLKRPAQDCSKKYGESLIIYSIDELSKEAFEEHEVSSITSKDIDFPDKIDRVHTINRDSKYEVIDVFKDKFDLLHGYHIFKRAYLKH